jgi:hypothetical protein
MGHIPGVGGPEASLTLVDCCLTYTGLLCVFSHLRITSRTLKRTEQVVHPRGDMLLNSVDIHGRFFLMFSPFFVVVMNSNIGPK